MANEKITALLDRASKLLTRAEAEPLVAPVPEPQPEPELELTIHHEDDKWVLYSKDGKKKLGTFDSEEAAKKREGQINFFKHKAASEAEESGAELSESYEEIRRAIESSFPAGDPQDYRSYPYIVATYDDYAVYMRNDKFYKVDWSIDESGSVALGATVEVHQKISYAELEEPKSTAKALNEFTWGVASASLAEGKPIQIMKTGDFNHPSYGEFSITVDDLKEIEQNFASNIRKQEIPVDIDHIHEGGAVGWFKSLEAKDDELWAVVDWTEEGEDLLTTGKFKYFSPHFGPWQDPESGEEFRIVLLSGAVTNFPFLKEMEPIELSEVRMSREAPPEATEAPKALVEMQQRLTELEAQNKSLVERTTAMTHEALVRRLTEIAHGNGTAGSRFVGDEPAHVDFMVSLADTFGEDSKELKHYIDIERAHAEQLLQADAFREVGTSTNGPSASMSDLDAEVEKVLAEGRARSRPEALSLAATEHPTLYSKYLNQHNKRASLSDE